MSKRSRPLIGGLCLLAASPPVLAAAPYSEKLYQSLRWRMIGPFRGFGSAPWRRR
jgi:hypothetical protein